MFLRYLKSTMNGGAYPGTVAAVSEIENIRFDKPVTMLAGENGSGKTTVMEILAAKSGAHRIGETAEGKQLKISEIDKALGRFTPVFSAHPSTAFFFQAEDFVRYIDYLKREETEALCALEEIETEYEGRGEYAKAQARMPYLRTISEIREMFDPPLTRLSHGEGFLRFFGSRIHPGGLYFLDEPEAALSYQNQLVLMYMLRDAAQAGSQMIVSTHSPVLLSYPGARIYELTENGAKEREYGELESVRFLRSFLGDTESFINKINTCDEEK